MGSNIFFSEILKCLEVSPFETWREINRYLGGYSSVTCRKSLATITT